MEFKKHDLLKDPYPVSYTHLDVYKRQVLLSEDVEQNEGKKQLEDVTGIFDFEDVYKRQVSYPGTAGTGV